MLWREKTNDNDVAPPKHRSNNPIGLTDKNQSVESNSYSYAYLRIS